MKFNYFRASVLAAIRQGKQPDPDELEQYLNTEQRPYPLEVMAYLKSKPKQRQGHPHNTSLGYRRFKRNALSLYEFRNQPKERKKKSARVINDDFLNEVGISSRTLDSWKAEQKQRPGFAPK